MVPDAFFENGENDTEIVHSEKLENGEVKVYVETPDERDGFHNMTCNLDSRKHDDEFSSPITKSP